MWPSLPAVVSSALTTSPPLLFHGLREGIKGELGPGDPPQELEEVISWVLQVEICMQD